MFVEILIVGALNVAATGAAVWAVNRRTEKAERRLKSVVCTESQCLAELSGNLTKRLARHVTEVGAR